MAVELALPAPGVFQATDSLVSGLPFTPSHLRLDSLLAPKGSNSSAKGNALERPAPDDNPASPERIPQTRSRFEPLNLVAALGREPLIFAAFCRKPLRRCRGRAAYPPAQWQPWAKENHALSGLGNRGRACISRALPFAVECHPLRGEATGARKMITFQPIRRS